MSNNGYRKALNRFNDVEDKEMDAELLASSHPGCACERASSPVGSPGPIVNGEILRLFLTSPTHVYVKRPEDLKKINFRARHLERAYSIGLSVCRLAHARKGELEHTAQILSDSQKKSSGDTGGVVAVLDFPVDSIRECPDGYNPLCAYETPLDRKPGGGYLRPAHGDVVNSQSGMSIEDKKKNRIMFCQKINEEGTIRRFDEIDDFNNHDYLPKNSLKQ